MKTSIAGVTIVFELISELKKVCPYIYHLLVRILLAAPDSDGLAMVVDLPPLLLLLLRPHPIDESVEEHLNPGHHLGEDQPDIDQLHVSRLRKAA